LFSTTNERPSLSPSSLARRRARMSVPPPGDAPTSTRVAVVWPKAVGNAKAAVTHAADVRKARRVMVVSCYMFFIARIVARPLSRFATAFRAGEGACPWSRLGDARTPGTPKSWHCRVILREPHRPARRCSIPPNHWVTAVIEESPTTAEASDAWHRGLHSRQSLYGHESPRSCSKAASRPIPAPWKNTVWDLRTA